MIVSQERAFLNAEVQLEKIRRYVEQAADSGERIDQVERELFGRLLELGLTLLRAFVDGQGAGDAGPSIEIDDAELRRLSGPRERRYLSVFGELAFKRRVYGTREGQKIEHVPLDVRLGLPEGEFSYVLMDWLQRLCVKESFHEAVTDLRAVLNLAPSGEHMKYDEYLAAGYPIGSGVAEGACRHLIKDRMEGTGMRWTVPGAQAMLHPRAVYLNGRWDEFIEYHAETERTRLYGKAAA